MIVGRHRDFYDDLEEFELHLWAASKTAGELLTILARCGLRPRDLGRALGLEDGAEPPWAHGHEAVPVAAVELICGIDQTRIDIADYLLRRYREEQGPVTLTIYRSDAAAFRAHAAADALRTFRPDLAVPAFAAVHRVATLEAAEALRAEGVFAVVAFEDDPMPLGLNAES